MNHWIKKLIFSILIGLVFVVPLISKAADEAFPYQSTYVSTPTEGWNPTNLLGKEQKINSWLNTPNLRKQLLPKDISQLENNLEYIKLKQGEFKAWIDAENLLVAIKQNPTSSDYQTLAEALTALEKFQSDQLSLTPLQSHFLTLDNLGLKKEIAYNLSSNPNYSETQRQQARANAEALQKQIDDLGTITEETRALGESSVPSVCGGFIEDFRCNVIYGITITVHNLAMPVAGKVLKLANDGFNLVFTYTVRDFSNYVVSRDSDGKDLVSAVQQGWTISRDLVNLALIFVLIYAALGLILKADNGMKKVVTNVIVVALLVNFSAMLTGIVIDASNIVANQFYEMAGKASGQAPTANGGAPDITTGMIKNSTTGTTIAALHKAQKEGKITPMGLLTRILIQDLGKIPFFVITAIVLAGAALMFFIRAIVLIFLIILSPLAFLAWALPSANKLFSKWSKSLIDNCIFAPAFFFLFMITILIVKSGPFASFGGQSGETDMGYIQNFIYLILMNGMMIGSVLVAKEFGAYGADGTMSVLNRVKGAVGRNTLGRVGVALNDGTWWTGRYGLDDLRDVIEESKWGKRARKYGNILTFGGLEGAGVGIKSVADSMAKSKYGGAASREDIIKKEGTGAKLRKGKPDRIAAYISGLSWQAQKEAYAALSTRERADVDEVLRNTNPGLIARLTGIGGPHKLADRLLDRMPPEEVEKMEKASRAGEVEERKRVSLANAKAAIKKYGEDGSEENRQALRAALRGNFKAEQVKDLTEEELIIAAKEFKSSHYAGAMDRKDIGAGTRDQMKDKRFKPLLDALGKKNSKNQRIEGREVIETDPTKPGFDKAKYDELVANVGKAMGDMTQKDIAGLDEQTFLEEPSVIDNLEKRDLIQIASNTTMPVKYKKTIRSRLEDVRDANGNIIKKGTGGPEIQEWFRSNTVGQAF